MGIGNNKLKLLYLMQILLDNTDEEHALTMQDLIDSLALNGITAERKSLYSDIESLRSFGMDIEGFKENKTFYYRVVSRDFELAELKLLVDSVQSAKFITEKKSHSLIKKLENLTSRYQSSQLSRQVYVTGRTKSVNESILYNVDRLHEAISEKKRISFLYFNWDPDKKQVLRHEGARYEVSPWALCQDDENYYLVAYDSDADLIKHFRVDKMLSIEVLSKKREGLNSFKSFDMASYTQKRFGMFDGAEESVTLLCNNNMAGVIIDRFGRDVNMVRKGKDKFEARVKVAISKQFFGWVFSLGEDVKITAPAHVVKDMKAEAKRLMAQYK